MKRVDMPHSHRFFLTLLASILGLSALGAPVPAGAAQSTVVPPPAHLRPVQSKTDCTAVLSLWGFVCETAVKAGDLQLIWDESDKTVTGYNVYRVDRGGHTLLGAATGTARYYLVKKPPGGYANMCFAVQANVGSHASADSPHYCYAPGATATTRSLKPSRTVTSVGLDYASNQCDGGEIFKTANRDFGSAFTMYFPWLLTGKRPSHPIDGVYAGLEAVFWKNPPPCTSSLSVPGHRIQNAKIRATATVAFDRETFLSLYNSKRRIKLYSATLTVEPLQTVSLASGKVTSSRGQWCELWVGIPQGGGGPIVRGSGTAVNVIDVVQPWIWYGTSNVSQWGAVGEFSIMPWLRVYAGPSPLFPSETHACLTKFSTPSLQLVYF